MQIATLSENIRFYRKENGITQLQLAEKLFVHTCTAGTPDLKLPEGKRLVPLLGAETVNVCLPEKYGVLFELV